MNVIQVAETDEALLPPRELQTIYYAVAEYLALEVMCRQYDSRARCQDTEDWLARLISIISKLVLIDARTLGRICWPLAVVEGVAKDRRQMDWIRNTMYRTRRITGASLSRTWSLEGHMLPSTA